MGRYRILIVDDEEIIRRGIQTYIQRDIHSVEKIFLAKSGEEALRILSEEEIHIVLTDICMDNMDGLSLIRQISRISQDIRVIVLTGYERFEYARECCKMGVQDFLLKPVDEAALRRSICAQIEELEKHEDQKKSQWQKSRAVGVTRQLKLEALCRGLLDGTVKGQELSRTLEACGYDRPYKIQVAVILPVMEKASVWKENYGFLYRSVKQICISMVDMQNDGITFEDNLGRICIFIFCKNDTEQLIRQLRSVIFSEFDMPCTFLIGGAVPGPEKVKYSYGEAISLLAVSEARKNEVIVSSNEEQRMHIFQDTVFELRNIMEDNLNRKDVFMKAFHTLFQCMESYNVSKSMLKKTVFSVVSDIYYEYMSERGGEGEREGELDRFISILTSGDVEDIEKVSFEFMENMLFSEGKRAHMLVEQAKAYIHEHLSEELTVTGIAEQLYVTVCYFSRLFKMQTGEGCNEYIIRKRMEKAKDLLANTSLKVGQISLMVGYKDGNYFSLAYKKYVGCSPKEYRQKMQEL